MYHKIFIINTKISYIYLSIPNYTFVNGSRTAIGSFGGTLENVPAIELGSLVLHETLCKACIPKETPAFTLNKVCGPGLKAIAIGCLRELGLENDRTNELGSGISLGHPIGCTGARQMVTGMYHMKRQNYKTGLISMCIGGGMGMAIWS